MHLPRHSDFDDASWRVRAVVAVANVAALATAFLVFVCYLPADAGYNGDLVHPFLFVQDVLEDASAFGTWEYSPALYAFPDWPLALIALAAPSKDAYLPLVYCALLLTLYSAAGGALLTVAGGARYWPATWSMASAFFVAGWLVLLFEPAPVSPWLLRTLSAPYIHTGAVLSTLAASALFLPRLRGQRGWAARLALAALTVATIASDLLFIAWFVLPAGIVALLCWRAHRRSGVP